MEMALRFLVLWIAAAAVAASGSVRRPSRSELQLLQQALGYQFNDTGPLLDALTHASYSLHNNGPLHLLGSSLIQASILLHSLQGDPGMSKESLEAAVTELGGTRPCAAAGRHLGLADLLMTAPRTEASSTRVLATAFQALFGAVALDSSPSKAMDVFWSFKLPPELVQGKVPFNAAVFLEG